MKNKKSSFDLGALVYYAMISIFILVLILFTYLFITNGFIMNIVYTPRGVESSVLITRALYSPTCFTYYDLHTLRSYPSVIDINKFTQENFDLCLDSDKIVSLTLKDQNENIIKQLNNKIVSPSLYGGEKAVFVYDKGLKPMVLEFRFKEDK
jgi:hypothetical protein